MNSPPMSANSFSSESTLSSESSLANSESTGPDVDWVVIGQGPRTPAWYFPRVASPPPAPTGVVRWQGPINVREDTPDDVTPRTSWIWKNKWLALTETALALHIWEPSPQQVVVQLTDVVVVVRSDLTPYCFLLETRDGVRRYFSFKHEEEMRDWLDDISTRSPEAAKAFTFVRDRPSEATPAVTQPPPQAPSGPPSRNVRFGDELIATPPARIPPSRLRAINIPPRPQVTPPRPPTLLRPVKEDVESSLLTLSSEEEDEDEDDDDVVRQGSVSIQEGSPEYWSWKSQWLVLTEKSLVFRAARCSPLAPTILPLKDIVSVGRSDRHPYCLLIKKQDKRQRYLSFTSDVDLFEWLDDIAARVPSRPASRTPSTPTFQIPSLQTPTTPLGPRSRRSLPPRPAPPAAGW